MQVEQLLQNKGIPFIPSGNDLKILCLNPEHEEKDPSLRIDKITGTMHCLVCGFKGSIFKHFDEKANWLLIKREQLRSKISEKLAESVGLEMPANAVPFDRDWRGVRGETLRKFEAFEHNNPEFIGRLVFPIRSLSGKIVGFNGRHFNSSHATKYLITPAKAKLPLFPVRPDIFNGRVILVEGIFDMLNLHDKGLTNAVCAFGTQKVTKEKLNILKIQGVSGIDLIFDSDKAGEKAAADVKRLCESIELNTREIALKEGDPGDLTAHKVLKLKEKLYG